MPKARGEGETPSLNRYYAWLRSRIPRKPRHVSRRFAVGKQRIMRAQGARRVSFRKFWRSYAGNPVLRGLSRKEARAQVRGMWLEYKKEWKEGRRDEGG